MRSSPRSWALTSQRRWDGWPDGPRDGLWELTVARTLRAHAEMRVDREAARATAASIPIAWFRDDALAAINALRPFPPEVDAALRQALAESGRGAEDNAQLVQRFGWHMRSLRAHADLHEWLRNAMLYLADLAETAPHPLLRANTLRALVAVAFDGPPDLEHALLSRTAGAYLACRGWRRDRYLGSLLLRLNAYDHQAALAAARGIDDRRLRRKALRAIGETALADNELPLSTALTSRSARSGERGGQGVR
jgi:hypothetical protein